MSDAPPLLLLPAFGAAGRSFDALRRALPAGRRALAPDLPGFGGAPDLPAPSVAAYADWVEGEVARAGLKRVVLGGWSMGGKIAFAVAARAPAWLAGLALVAPSPPSPEPMDETDRRAQLTGLPDRDLARRSVASLVGEGDPSSWMAQALDDRMRSSPVAWAWWLESGSREDLTPLGPLSTPCRLVVGGRDPHLGGEAQQRLTAPHFTDVRITSIPGSGHFVPLEAPEALAAALED